MPKVSNKMDNKYDENFIVLQAAIEDNKQEIKSKNQHYDDKMMKLTEDFKSMLTAITYQINTIKSSQTQNYSPKPLKPTTVVPANRRDPPLDSGKSTKISGMWNLKHDISLPKFYELLINT